MTRKNDGLEKHEPPPGFFLEKPLPSSPESERVILGAVLLDNALLAEAIGAVRREDFYSPLHRRVFGAMTSLFERGERIDPILIGEELKKEGHLESIGGVATITNLTYGLPHFSGIEKYTRIVRDYAKVRELISACGLISATALDEEHDQARVLDFAQSKINEVCSDSATKGFISGGDLARETVLNYFAQRDSGQTSSGLLTGFRDIDALLNGLKKKALYILAGRPGLGKTALAMKIVENSCEAETSAVVAVFSLEMAGEQLMKRAICASAQVEFDLLDKGLLTPSQEQQLLAAANRFAEKNIEIDDTPGISPQQIRAKAMMIKAKYKRLDLIVIDFFQKLSPSRRAESARHEYAAIARELKNLAKDLDVPVLSLSALNRECEKRNPPKPRASDLGESNAIESEADVIAFVYRAAKYFKEADPTEAELIFEKNRYGPEKTIRLGWIGEYTRFDDY